MPTELAFMEILMPTLLPVFIVAAALYWLFDSLLARCGIYRCVWHPALFRVALFVCLFGSLGLVIYH